jgi:hypothetical protein
MELVAGELKATGAYLARTLSYEVRHTRVRVKAPIHTHTHRHTHRHTHTRVPAGTPTPATAHHASPSEAPHLSTALLALPQMPSPALPRPHPSSDSSFEAQGVRFELIHVRTTDAFRTLYDGCAALWAVRRNRC